MDTFYFSIHDPFVDLAKKKKKKKKKKPAKPLITFPFSDFPPKKHS